MDKLILKEFLTAQENEVLKKLKSTLQDMLSDRLVKIVLYGSKARGDYDPESDIDIAVVVRGLTRKLKNEILDEVIKIEFENHTPISTFILSEDDFKLLRQKERRIALDIEKEGMLL